MSHKSSIHIYNSQQHQMCYKKTLLSLVLCNFKCISTFSIESKRLLMIFSWIEFMNKQQTWKEHVSIYRNPHGCYYKPKIVKIMYVFIDEWEVGQYAQILHNHGETLELPFNSTGGLVRSWLFCKHIFSCVGKFLMHAWGRCGGSNKKISYINLLWVKLILACQEMLRMCSQLVNVFH